MNLVLIVLFSFVCLLQGVLFLKPHFVTGFLDFRSDNETRGGNKKKKQLLLKKTVPSLSLFFLSPAFVWSESALTISMNFFGPFFAGFFFSFLECTFFSFLLCTFVSFCFPLWISRAHHGTRIQPAYCRCMTETHDVMSCYCIWSLYKCWW